MSVEHSPDEVVVRMDPATARVLAEVWQAAAQDRSTAAVTDRPLWLIEVACLKRAATFADRAAGRQVAPPVPVPLLAIGG